MARRRHADIVVEAVQGASVAATSRLAASWRRCLLHHRLDPAAQREPQRLSARETRAARDAAGPLPDFAAPQLDRLGRSLASSGGCVILTDAAGVVLDHRAGAADAPMFEGWGLWRGGVWSEQAEGTNGIGTCIAEERPVTIRRDQHFHSRNTMMNCMDAPIFGPGGALAGALDVSSLRSDQDDALGGLIAEAVTEAARQIEFELFRHAFPDARIVVSADNGPGRCALLAVDRDDLVVGATRAARKLYGLGLDAPLAPTPAADLLGQRRDAGLDDARRAELRRALARAAGDKTAAARALGIGRATLYRQMKRVGLA